MMKRDLHGTAGIPARTGIQGAAETAALRTAGVPARTRRGGFTLIEVLFAIAILGVGIVGILTLFVSGINMAGWAGSRSQASMEAQSLYAQLLSYHIPDADPNKPGIRGYIEVMRDEFYPSNKWAGAAGTTYISKWLHAYNFTSPSASATLVEEPVPISAGHDYWWQCRVTNYMMNKDEPLDKSQDVTVPKDNPINPPGLVEVAIGIYKQWKTGKEPLAVYTTLISLESK